MSGHITKFVKKQSSYVFLKLQIAFYSGLFYIHNNQHMESFLSITCYFLPAATTTPSHTGFLIFKWF